MLTHATPKPHPPHPHTSTPQNPSCIPSKYGKELFVRGKEKESSPKIFHFSALPLSFCSVPKKKKPPKPLRNLDFCRAPAHAGVLSDGTTKTGNEKRKKDERKMPSFRRSGFVRPFVNHQPFICFSNQPSLLHPPPPSDDLDTSWVTSRFPVPVFISLAPIISRVGVWHAMKTVADRLIIARARALTRLDFFP